MTKPGKDRALYGVALLYSVCVYGPMAVMSIGAGITLAAWLGLRWGSYGKDLRAMRQSPVFGPTLFLGVACLWSLVWAKASGLAFYGMRPTITWDDTRKAWHLLFPFILFAVFARLGAADLRKVVKLWFWLGVASAVMGIVQYYVPFYEPMMLPHTHYEGHDAGTGLLRLLEGRWHATGFAGFHLSYAAIIGFPAAVSLAAMAVLFRREGLSRRTGMVVFTALLFFIANICTYSKIAWLAMPLTVVLIAVVGFQGKPRYVIIGAIVAFCAVFSMSSSFRERMGADKRTYTEREQVWGANLEMIRQFPVFGVGWHRNSELSRAYYAKVLHSEGFESHAHNNILDQWATTGLFGLIGFFWLNIVLVWMSFRLYRDNHDLLWRSMGLGLVAGWFCLQLNGTTQVNWWDATVMHQIGWVTAITMEGYRRYCGGRV
ncbi:MAG: O-antigen ligase family protein [Deltaproteobacteria bacterium]|nr:O-antigen ligase family protein [Deltaproteobacteria bacterium]